VPHRPFPRWSLVLAAALPLPGGPVAGAPPPAAAPRAPALALAPCPAADSLPGTLCGALAVPEDPARPGGRVLRLGVAVVPALAPEPGAVPLFHLEGGPGLGAIEAAAKFYLGPGSAYRRGRDVVLVDQRGTGRSGALRCPALERRSPLDDYDPIDEVTACRRDLERRANLSMYSTSIAADDLDRVRTALGAERVDLWAISYGTRLAQTYLKAHGEHVRSAVLVGFAPLDYRAPLFHAVAAQRALDLLFFECQFDPDCAARYPELRRDWRSLLERLDAGPVVVPPPAPGEPTTTIRRGPFGEALRGQLYTSAGRRRLPGLIHRAGQGDFAPLLAALASPGFPIAEGLYLTIACSEGSARVADDEVGPSTAGTFLGDYREKSERAACAAWPKYDVPESFYAPPGAGPPLLVLSGEMDNVTPPAWAEEFCSHLPTCRLVSIPEMSHAPDDLDEWVNGDCFDDLARAFFDHPGELDPSCVRDMRPPPLR
jgi:pimeloyl-ACP methyl ester carboxylesterase